MGTIPFPGDGIAAHLAWIRDQVGDAGTWLVSLTRREGAGFAHPNYQQLLTTDLLATLEELTADVSDSWCPDGSLEVVGLQVGEWSTAHDNDEHPFFELDLIELSLTDPDPFDSRKRHLECSRLPALYVEHLRRIIDRYWTDWERDLIHSLLGEWRSARADEVGLSRHAQPGLHRRWARAGCSILTALADHYDHYSAKAADHTHNLVHDVHQPISALARQILHEQALPPPPHGPLSGQHSPS